MLSPASPLIAAILVWRVPNSAYRMESDPILQATAAMQSALENHLPRGARVQMLDADNGAFLAVARAGMRQATPHIQWFSLLVGKHPPRREFLDAIEGDPPAACPPHQRRMADMAGISGSRRLAGAQRVSLFTIRPDCDGSSRLHRMAVLSQERLTKARANSSA